MAFTGMVVADVGALSLCKSYVNEDQAAWKILIAVILFATIPFFLVQVLRQGNGVGVTNLCWNIVSTLVVLGIGTCLYNEQLSNGQCIGALLGIVAVSLMMFSDS